MNLITDKVIFSYQIIPVTNGRDVRSSSRVRCDTFHDGAGTDRLKLEYTSASWLASCVH